MLYGLQHECAEVKFGCVQHIVSLARCGAAFGQSSIFEARRGGSNGHPGQLLMLLESTYRLIHPGTQGNPRSLAAVLGAPQPF